MKIARLADDKLCLSCAIKSVTRFEAVQTNKGWQEKKLIQKKGKNSCENVRVTRFRNPFLNRNLHHVP